MTGPEAPHRKGIVAWWAQNSIAANLLMVVAIVVGIMSIFSLEREVFPAGQYNGGQIVMNWPGASPTDVEEQLVTRIEEVMADLDGLQRIVAFATEGNARVQLRAKDDYDIDQFMDEVKLRVDTINNLPADVRQPQVSRWKDEQQYFGVAVYGDVDERTLKRVSDDFRDELASRYDGTKLSDVWGILGEEVTIEVSEESLRRYNLSFSDVANAIRASSLNSSGGGIKTDVGTFTLNTRELADTQEQFEDIVVRELPSGANITVGDVAKVIDGFVDADLITTFNGKRTTFVMVNQPEVMYIDSYANDVREFIDYANEEFLPEGIQAQMMFDMSDMYNYQMKTITNSALLGTFLVLIVLILFLRPIVALWVTVGIVTAFAGGFMLLPLFGVSLNILSFFAILLVIGVIVDDAIVVGENIHKQVESGESQGVDAAILGTQLVVKPVVFGVITTMIMFAPWALLSGPERQFTAQITYVVIAALSFSLIESMLILPAHLAHMKKENKKTMNGFLKFQKRIADSLIWFAENLFRPVLVLAIKFRYATVALFISIFLLSVGLLTNGLLRTGFMPEIDSDIVNINIELPEGTPFVRTQEVFDQLLAGFEKAQQDMKDDFPEWEGEFLTDISGFASDRRVRAWVATLPPEDRPVGLGTKAFADALREATGPIPDAEEIDFAHTFNDSGDRYRVALRHNDLDLLQRAALDVRTQLATYSSTYDIGDSMSAAAEEIQFTLKPGAQSLGLTLADLSQQIRQAYWGVEVQRLPRDGEDVRVMVRYPQETRRSLDSLQNFRVRTNDGREIPMSQVADLDYQPGIDRIARRDGLRSVAVFSEVAGETSQVRNDMNENFWPEFEEKYPEIIRGNLGGYQDQVAFQQNLMTLMLGAIICMYILLAIAFKSYFQPFLIMSALPFAFTGAMLGHLVFDVQVALFSVFGIAAAAGVVINDNLVLIDSVNRRRQQGIGAVKALVDSATSRFRPILLTSVTTFLGILPMIAERSVGAQFMKPMVVALGGAVAFALFVSLFMVPALYAVGAELARVSRWLWKGLPITPIGTSFDDDNGREYDGVAAPAE